MKKQLILFIAALCFISLIVVSGLFTVGYAQLFSNLFDEMKYDFRNWNLSTEKKYDLRFGKTFAFLNYLNEHTPTDAIILMPPDSILLDKKSDYIFLEEITNKSWASYFVYPRKLIYEKEKNSNSYYSTASHVVIMNEWGKDKLRYNARINFKIEVAPINPQR